MRNELRWPRHDVLLVVALAAGLGLRIYVAIATEPIVDEFFQAEGARAVLARGLPLLESGYLYLHGATYSYLAAPLIAVFGERLEALRALSVFMGASLIVLTYITGSRMFGPRAGLIAAVLVALNPTLVIWAGRARMYAILAPLVVTTLYLHWAAFVKKRHAGWSRLLAGGSLAAAIATHVGALLLAPALLLTWLAAMIRNRRVRQFDIAYGALVGAATLLILWDWTGANDVLSSLTVGQFRSPIRINSDRSYWALWDWAQSASVSEAILYALGPGVAATTLVLRRDRRAPHMGNVKFILATLAFPLLLILFLRPGSLSVGRYTSMFIAPASWLIGHYFVRGCELFQGRERSPRRATRGASIVLIGLSLLAMAPGVGSGIEHPEDPGEAFMLASASIEGRQGTIVANFPSIGEWNGVRVAFALGDMSGNFTHRNPQGLLVDRWAARPAITKADDLTEIMKSVDELWIIITPDGILQQFEFGLADFVRREFVLRYRSQSAVAYEWKSL